MLEEMALGVEVDDVDPLDAGRASHCVREVDGDPIVHVARACAGTVHDPEIDIAPWPRLCAGDGPEEIHDGDLRVCLGARRGGLTKGIEIRGHGQEHSTRVQPPAPSPAAGRAHASAARRLLRGGSASAKRT